MEITLLVGNGFDLNLGLNTRYVDFISEYKKEAETDSAFIKFMKGNIEKDEKLWADAEIALGKSTKYLTLKDGEEAIPKAEEFSNFHIDICEKLASYLDNEQERVPSFDQPEIFAKKMANSLNSYLNGLREESRNFIQRSYSKVGGGIKFNFIVFNYTHILDDLITISRKYQQFLGNRNYSGTAYQNTYGDIIHVHGTTQKDMVFAVNDISQITNSELYNKVPELYLHQLIKIQTNRDNEQRTDEKAEEILKRSNLIYIYGMSIGETDRLWWQRIVRYMKDNNPNVCIIVHKRDAGDEDLIRTQFLLKRETFRDNFIESSVNDENAKKQIKSRIFITSYNIFQEFTDLVSKNSLQDYAKELFENELNDAAN